MNWWRKFFGSKPNETQAADQVDRSRAEAAEAGAKLAVAFSRFGRAASVLSRASNPDEAREAFRTAAEILHEVEEIRRQVTCMKFILRFRECSSFLSGPPDTEVVELAHRYAAKLQQQAVEFGKAAEDMAKCFYNTGRR